MKFPLPDEIACRFWTPLDRPMIQWLALDAGARVLDAGCGSGIHTLLLAEALGSSGSATGIDLQEDRLKVARARVRHSRIQAQIRFERADLHRLPFPDRHFDLVWSSHVLHGQPDVVSASCALLRKVKPGGRLVVRENRLSSGLLPYDFGIGKPGFEHRTDLLWLNWFLNERKNRSLYPKGWIATLLDAGAARVQPKSFLNEVSPPFSKDQQEYMLWHLRRRYDWPGLTEADRRVLDRLTDPRDSRFALRRPDLHYTSISTVYVCEVA